MKITGKNGCMKVVVPLAALLVSCGQQASPKVENSSGNAAQPAPTQAQKPAANAFAFDEDNDLIEFHFSWSAEAAVVPQLVERFHKEMEKAKAGLIAGAREDKAFRDKEKLEFHGHMSSTSYETAGQSNRLLSLSVEAGSFTGGAHGNAGMGGLLWDRHVAKEITNKELFAEASNRDRLLTQRWCDALNKAREDKRGELVGSGGMFDDCPALDDIAIIPTDKDGNGKFERLMLVASPYVAGPWAEGSYEVDLAVTPDLISALKGEFRASFDAPQTQ